MQDDMPDGWRESSAAPGLWIHSTGAMVSRRRKQQRIRDVDDEAKQYVVTSSPVGVARRDARCLRAGALWRSAWGLDMPSPWAREVAPHERDAAYHALTAWQAERYREQAAAYVEGGEDA